MDPNNHDKDIETGPSRIPPPPISPSPGHDAEHPSSPIPPNNPKHPKSKRRRQTSQGSSQIPTPTSAGSNSGSVSTIHSAQSKAISMTGAIRVHDSERKYTHKQKNEDSDAGLVTEELLFSKDDDIQTGPTFSETPTKETASEESDEKNLVEPTDQGKSFVAPEPPVAHTDHVYDNHHHRDDDDGKNTKPAPSHSNGSSFFKAPRGLGRGKARNARKNVKPKDVSVKKHENKTDDDDRSSAAWSTDDSDKDEESQQLPGAYHVGGMGASSSTNALGLPSNLSSSQEAQDNGGLVTLVATKAPSKRSKKSTLPPEAEVLVAEKLPEFSWKACAAGPSVLLIALAIAVPISMFPRDESDVSLNTLLKEYPNCVVDDLNLLGDQQCNPGPYNTLECGYDAGDCLVEGYPECRVDFPFRVGNGICNGEIYDVEQCGYDGGDCIVAGYPDCRVDNPQWVGDGRCNPGLYNTLSCGYDGGDCLVDGYPDCRVDYPDFIGDGRCNSGPFNTMECGYDGGDCLIFNSLYPDCQVDIPFLIGSGICDGGAYNTEECGYDGGDCLEFNSLYPDCQVGIPVWIGDGECDGGAYNTEECGYDGGDCL